MLKGFKDFVLRGNVVELAVAVVVGTAFAAVVKAITDHLITPLLNAVGTPSTGDGWKFSLRHGSGAIEQATLVDVGSIVSALINFLVVAAVVYFVLILPLNRLAEMRKRGQEPEPAAPAEDILLLQEIRDLLRARQP